MGFLVNVFLSILIYGTKNVLILRHSFALLGHIKIPIWTLMNIHENVSDGLLFTAHVDCPIVGLLSKRPL